MGSGGPRGLQNRWLRPAQRQVRFLPLLSELPQIEKLLALEALARWFAALSRPLVARIASEAVGKAREALLRPEALAGEAAGGAAALEAEIVKRIDAACRQTARRRILRVVNAAAVFLVLSALAKGRQVLVSRGEQVQIGGGFRIRGFTEKPAVAELARSLPSEVILAVDQGSGANLVCFSADKLLGGPQAGLIAGRRELIEILREHPLSRVFRPGKTIYSLLEQFLVEKLNGSLRGQAEQLIASTLATGGGSGSDESYPSISIELEAGGDPQLALDRLRELDPPIIGTIADGKVLLNLATVHLGELELLRAALQLLLGTG